jgi:hypothetical protein
MQTMPRNDDGWIMVRSRVGLVISLVVTSVFLSLAATFVAAAVADRLPRSVIVNVVVAAWMPACFIAWLWKGTATIEAVIRSVPLRASEPARSVVVSGVFGACLLGVLVTAGAQISPQSLTHSFSPKLVSGVAGWGFLTFALLGFWLSRRRGAEVPN